MLAVQTVTIEEVVHLLDSGVECEASQSLRSQRKADRQIVLS